MSALMMIRGELDFHCYFYVISQFIIFLSGLFLLIASLLHVEWDRPYSKRRLVNYIIASAGLSSSLSVLFSEQQLAVPLLIGQMIILMSMCYLYRRFRYNSGRIIYAIINYGRPIIRH